MRRSKGMIKYAEQNAVHPARPLAVVPTYNERSNVSQLIPAILNIDRSLHVLIVDDASPDDTAGEITRMQKNGCASRLFLQSRSGKFGLGSAYVHGFKWGIARGYDFLIQMDADWSHNPADLKKMLQLAAQSDFVIGTRYISGGGTANWCLGRRLLSQFASVYSRMILQSDFADFTGGFNGWSRDVLRGINLDSLRSEGYSFQIELKYKADRLGYTHAEFPIVFTERRSGKSKMSTSIAMEACWRVWTFKLALKRRTAKDMAFQAAPDQTAIRLGLRHQG
jgi:dolichol-phosphate mannosyltransferase